MPLTDDTSDLRRKLTHAEAVIAELRGVVAGLRKQIEAQQAHIHRLVKITFGRGGERVEGPTLFDGMAAPDAEVTTLGAPPTSDAPPMTRRTGHGRRCKPKDLPRRREEIDLSEAEKACPCCGKPRVRIGAETSEQLDYRPASLFVVERVRHTYACPGCSRTADPADGPTPTITTAPLPAQPIDKGLAAARDL